MLYPDSSDHGVTMNQVHFCFRANL